MSQNIRETLLTKSDCYKAGKTISVKGVMLHSVGCAQPSASTFVTTWNQPGIKACVHAFIDANTGEVYQTLPWNHHGWHGGGSSNDSYIGVEMCEPSTIQYVSGAKFKDLNPSSTKAAVLRTYHAAVDLFAFLCQEFHLDPLQDGVILSHKEGHLRGIASNHGDPEHLWSRFGLAMDGFRQEVAYSLGKNSSSGTESSSPPSDSATYRIRVITNTLNIRTGPGTNFPITGQIKDKGVYTIINEATGVGASSWGQLKSRAGWIALDYTKPI